MQINRPPPTDTSAGVKLPESASRADNPLAQLVGQIVAAQVTQSRAVQAAATQVQQYQSILQIGSERVMIITDRPLQPGTQLQFNVTSPQSIQIVEQPGTPPATPPVNPAADVATSLLNSMLRQALPLQKPVTELLTTAAAALLLDNAPAGSKQTNPLAAGVRTGSAATIAVLKPLLVQLLRTQLTPESVTHPDALRNALASSGLFRESRLVQWAQAMLQQFPNASMPTSSIPGASIVPCVSNSPGAASMPAAATIPTGTGANALPPLNPVSPLAGSPHTAIATAIAQNVQTPPSPASQLSALANASVTTAGWLNSSATETPSGNGATQPTPTIKTTTGISSTTPFISAGGDAMETDIDTLRNQLLQALTAKMQKSMAGLMTPSAATAAATPGTAAGVATPAQNASKSGIAMTNLPLQNSTAAPLTQNTGVPISAKTTTAGAGLQVEGDAPADTKTALEKLVTIATRQLISNTGNEPPSQVDEEHVLALLRLLPSLQPDMHTGDMKTKPQDDDNQWLLQLLRNGFGALKHLQLQQATNLSAAPAQQVSTETVATPVQIELPLLVAQQWQTVNIEIDRSAPENRPDGTKSERSWRVTLRFELPQQGVIVAQLNVSGVHVNATLWAEKQATCQQLQQQLKDLSDRLGRVGAHVNTLDVRHGQPPSAKTRIEQCLIDIRT